MPEVEFAPSESWYLWFWSDFTKTEIRSFYFQRMVSFSVSSARVDVSSKPASKMGKVGSSNEFRSIISSWLQDVIIPAASIMSK